MNFLYHPLCFGLIRGDHETFNRLALKESIETRSLPTLFEKLEVRRKN